jgi:hypothetical protein
VLNLAIDHDQMLAEFFDPFLNAGFVFFKQLQSFQNGGIALSS